MTYVVLTDNGTLDVIIVNYICSGGPRLPLFIQMVNLKNPSFLACYDFIIKSAAFALCWNILTLQVTGWSCFASSSDGL